MVPFLLINFEKPIPQDEETFHSDVSLIYNPYKSQKNYDFQDEIQQMQTNHETIPPVKK